MGAGSRTAEVNTGHAPVRWTPAAVAWMLMMLAETGHAAVREIWLGPMLGALRARQFGVLIGSILVLLIAWACSRWIRAETRRAQIVVGAFWAALTLVFEFAVGRAMHLSWSRILSDYDPAQGGFMSLGLAVMFIAPLWVSRWPGARKK
jgi:hypothetical protein